MESCQLSPGEWGEAKANLRSLSLKSPIPNLRGRVFAGQKQVGGKPPDTPAPFRPDCSPKDSYSI